MAAWKETDPVPDVSAVFNTIGLRTNTDTAKQSYAARQQFHLASQSA